MTSALVIVLAAWLGFFLFLIGVLAIGELWAEWAARRRGVDEFDVLERIWALPPAERHNDRRAA